MLTRFTFIATLVLGLVLINSAEAQQFNQGDIDFNGPNGAWVNTPGMESVGYMIIRNRENSFRIDVFDDGGRFLIRSYCKETTRRLKNIQSVVISTDGNLGYMRDCDGSNVAVRRKNALRALFRIVPDSAAPPAIEIYLLQLLVEHATFESGG